MALQTILILGIGWRSRLPFPTPVDLSLFSCIPNTLSLPFLSNSFPHRYSSFTHRTHPALLSMFSAHTPNLPLPCSLSLIQLPNQPLSPPLHYNYFSYKSNSTLSCLQYPELVLPSISFILPRIRASSHN